MLLYFIINLFLVFGAAVVVGLDNFSFGTTLTAVITCISNVGPGLDEGDKPVVQPAEHAQQDQDGEHHREHLEHGGVLVVMRLFAYWVKRRIFILQIFPVLCKITGRKTPGGVHPPAEEGEGDKPVVQPAEHAQQDQDGEHHLAAYSGSGRAWEAMLLPILLAAVGIVCSILGSRR